MLKRYIIIFAALVCSISMFAQEKPKFDPAKFETDLEQYVIKQAGITANEQKKFIPIFREMRQKQVALMEAARKQASKKPTTESEWAQAIKTKDNNEIQLKKLAQTYHNQLLKVISASKLMKVIRAEESFHRQQFKQYAGKGQGPAKGPGKGHGGQPGKGGPHPQRK